MKKYCIEKIEGNKHNLKYQVTECGSDAINSRFLEKEWALKFIGDLLSQEAK